MPGLKLERELYHSGSKIIAGIDEAGRGPLAGPVVAAAVILPRKLCETTPWLNQIDDSKKLSQKRRESAYDLIFNNAISVAVCEETPEVIDKLGIGNATIKAMFQAIQNLDTPPEYLLFDFVPIKSSPLPFRTVVKGDSISYSIAAASIIAKVTRDRYMTWADKEYPGYGFAQHKGYPTKEHLSRLKELGPCGIHRRSFAPVHSVLTFDSL
jgi:ribonuclease HII